MKGGTPRTFGRGTFRHESRLEVVVVVEVVAAVELVIVVVVKVVVLEVKIVVIVVKVVVKVFLPVSWTAL